MGRSSPWKSDSVDTVFLLMCCLLGGRGHYRVPKKGPGTPWGDGRHVDSYLEVSRSLETVWKFAGDVSHG